MNPGIGEEGVKVFQSMIDGLKGHPAFFMLLLLNLIFLGFMYISLNKTYDRTTRELEKNDLLIAKLIEKCK